MRIMNDSSKEEFEEADERGRFIKKLEESLSSTGAEGELTVATANEVKYQFEKLGDLIKKSDVEIDELAWKAGISIDALEMILSLENRTQEPIYSVVSNLYNITFLEEEEEEEEEGVLSSLDFASPKSVNIPYRVEKAIEGDSLAKVLKLKNEYIFKILDAFIYEVGVFLEEFEHTPEFDIYFQEDPEYPNFQRIIISVDNVNYPNYEERMKIWEEIEATLERIIKKYEESSLRKEKVREAGLLLTTFL